MRFVFNGVFENGKVGSGVVFMSIERLYIHQNRLSSTLDVSHPVGYSSANQFVIRKE